MRPTKNRRFCPDCGRAKMFFETEDAAKRFIEYNSDDIEKEHGFKPIRSYYCDCCCGWHVTSKDYVNFTKSPHRRYVDRYIEQTKKHVHTPSSILDIAKRLIALSEKIKNGERVKASDIPSVVDKGKGCKQLRKKLKAISEILQASLNNVKDNIGVINEVILSCQEVIAECNKLMGQDKQLEDKLNKLR
jgi:hypothetical protein